jgi:hypothetical protein
MKRVGSGTNIYITDVPVANFPIVDKDVIINENTGQC